MRIGRALGRRSRSASSCGPVTRQMCESRACGSRISASAASDGSLTRAGALPIDAADLHVVLAATHVFDDSLMATVVEQNVNPMCGTPPYSLARPLVTGDTAGGTGSRL